MNLQQYCLNSPKPLKLVLGSFPAIRLNNFSLQDIYFDSKKMTKVALDFDSMFHLDFIRTITDLTFECEAFGAETKFSRLYTPRVVKPIITCRKDINNFNYKLDEKSRFSIYKDSYKQLKESTDTPVIASITGPLTVLASVTSPTYFHTLFKNNDVESINLIMDKILSLNKELITQLNIIAPHCIMVSDPVASFLNPTQFNSILLKPLSNIFSHFNGMKILHICGDVSLILPQIFQVPANGFSFDETVDMHLALEKASEIVSSNKILLGNISPIAVMVKGTSEQVVIETQKLLSLWKQHKNFIPATGCTLPYNTPLENIRSFLETY